ncbi:cytochrome P450 [Streptosporangium sp. NPDC049046]|uniref:cytochrome P450 n=1 Tax=Streptosporangium sp. NPDC049046 TaxID=3155031 RepID=UPI0034227ACB
MTAGTQIRLPAHLPHPFSPAGRADPYPAYDWLRSRAPVHHDVMSRLWLVTGHADCAAVLRDRRFSASAGQQGRARGEELPPSMLTTDPPDHTRLRAPGLLLLGPAAIASVAGGIAADVDDLLERLAGETVVDAVRQIGSPLSTSVFLRLFGLAESDRKVFEQLAQAASINLDPLAGPQVAALGRSAMSELSRFLDERRASAAPSPLTRFAADDRLTRAEMLGVLGLAVVGGWQPLAEAIGNALYWLLPRPRALAALREGGDESARTAMDELLRLEAPIPFTARVAVENVTLPGGEVPRGARVLAVVAAANRDPAVFDRPGELLLDRTPNPHLAFGGGPHFCLAAQLVRQTGAVLLARLAGRFPAASLADEKPAWAATLIPRRLRSLPVNLGDPASPPTDPGNLSSFWTDSGVPDFPTVDPDSLPTASHSLPADPGGGDAY